MIKFGGNTGSTCSGLELAIKTIGITSHTKKRNQISIKPIHPGNPLPTTIHTSPRAIKKKPLPTTQTPLLIQTRQAPAHTPFTSLRLHLAIKLIRTCAIAGVRAS
jgi:hypothetical protein